MLFFKYQKPGNLEFTMLRHGEIYFARPSELNDAHECRPRMVLSGSADLWKRLAKYVLEATCYKSGLIFQLNDAPQLLKLARPMGQTLKSQVGRRDLAIEKLGDLFLRILRPLIDDIMPSRSADILRFVQKFLGVELPRLLEEGRYIASFSLVANNPTMWGHYADAERGFVVIFKSSIDRSMHVMSPLEILHGTRQLGGNIFELDIYKDEHLELKNVIYKPKLPKINAFRQLISKFTYTEMEDHHDVPLLLEEDAKEKQESSLGLVKYSDWRYEKEVRVFLPNYGELPPDARALRVASENIAGLIFGPKMSSTDKLRAILCCHLMRKSRKDGNSDDFAFFQAKRAVDKFNLSVVPVGILEGQYFPSIRNPIKDVGELPQTQARYLEEMAQAICS